MSYTYPQSYSVVPAAAPAQATFTTQPVYDPTTYAAPQVAPSGYAPATQYVQTPPPQQYTTQYSSRDEIRTIFVTGFPADVKERELMNTCRFMSGFEAASLKGFVLFKYGQAAHQAVNMLNGLDFCEGCKLRAEMARKNMYFRSDERPTQQFRTEGGPVPASAGPPPSGFVDRNNDNPPCDTLFIGNLSTSVSDEEITQYFRSLKGDKFQACKVNRANNRVSAFVQFTDVPTAQEVHASQQGKELPGSDRGPMRIQFSKNALGSFGKRTREEAAAQQYQPPPAPMHTYAPPPAPYQTSPVQPVSGVQSVPAVTVTPGAEYTQAPQVAPYSTNIAPPQPQ